MPKPLPRTGATAMSVQAEGVAAYRIFISRLLDLTDNIVDGKVVPPPQRACATTATTPISWSPPTRARPPSPTSPTRSRPSTASGSATRSPPAARPATTTRRWASRRAAPGSASSGTSASWTSTSSASRSRVVGVGDMSGDVFGNGMLLSPAHPAAWRPSTTATSSSIPTRTRAQPSRAQAPVRAAALELAGLRQAADLRAAAYSRARAKSIALSPEARALLGLGKSAPRRRGDARDPEGARSTCCGSAASAPTCGRRTESDAEVGDRANDAVRIDGAELRAQVIGEGANLGVTQRGRIEYAPARRPHQHRLHRQLGGRQHLRPRGQHQDRAGRRPCAPARSGREARTRCSPR